MVSKTSVILIASLCLNAALIGGVAAGVHALNSENHGYEKRSDDRKGRPPGPGSFDDQLARAAFDRLMLKDRMAFRRSLAQEWRETRDERDAMRETRVRLAELLMEADFNREDAETALETIRASEMAMRARLHSRLLDLLANMDDADRVALIRDIQDQSERFDDRRKKFEREAEKRLEGFGPPLPPPDDN